MGGRNVETLVSVIIPVYDEEEAIGDDLDLIIRTMEASGYPYEVIVVDDGSTDSTASIVEKREKVRLIRHPYNLGVGAARNTGLRNARGELIVMTDGDGSYPNGDIPRLLALLGEYDMVIGARSRETGNLRPLRVIAKHLIRLLASYLTGVMIPDLNSGFRAFKKRVAEKYYRILPATHSWVGTITIAFLNDSHPVKFIPIDYYPRKGRSKFHPLGDTYQYLALVVRAIMYFNPLKVLLPITLFLFTVGGLKTVHDIFKYYWHLAPSTVVILLSAIQIGAFGLLADLIVRRGK